MGILGGTFDPPHLGHLIVAEEAQGRLALAQVLFIPAGQPWLKAGQAITPAHHRLEMTRLAVEGNPVFQVSDLEVQREGPSYTTDTLEQVGREHPESEVFFIVGEDSAQELSRWHRPGRLLELCTLVVYRRPGGETFDPQVLDELSPGASRRVVLLEGPQIGISATDLRRRAAEGRSLRHLVPQALEEYIRRHGLYTLSQPSSTKGEGNG